MKLGVKLAIAVICTLAYAAWLFWSNLHAQANGIPAEPVIINTKVGGEGLGIEPTDPKPIVGVFLVICRDHVFQCSDNGAEFRVCARWELAELGVRNPRFTNGKCVAAKQ